MTKLGEKSQKKPLIIINPDSGIIPVNYIVSLGLDFLKQNFLIIKSSSKEEAEKIINQNSENHEIGRAHV